jgi:hypothetical protein
MCFLRSY